MLINMASYASSGKSERMPCLDRRLGLVPGAVEVAAVHLGHQGAPKLLSIPKATQAREVCSHIGDDNSQVCVQVTLWVPANMGVGSAMVLLHNSGESKRVFTGDANWGSRSFAWFEHSTVRRLQRIMLAQTEEQDLKWCCTALHSMQQYQNQYQTFRKTSQCMFCHC